MKLYGCAPRVVSHVDVDNKETGMCLYMPISLKGHVQPKVPSHFRHWLPLVRAVYHDMGASDWTQNNIYLTVKSMFVSGGSTGQRPGWHSDGFMTNDINYLWYDSQPTQFYSGGQGISLPQDHHESLRVMEEVCEERYTQTYPDKTLLRLDELVIHRPAPIMQPCFRNFVKISVSKEVYAREGNTRNYDPHMMGNTKNWTYEKRSMERNCPIGGGV